ncbi:MAG: NADP-dependent oxidoreductase [Burkholderiaceae bacterium]
MNTRQQWRLGRRPTGAPTPQDFMWHEEPLPTPGPGEVLVENHFLSLDPYMRGRMNAGKNYAVPQPLHEVMIGGTVGQVVQSRHPDFAVGDAVVGMGGWQSHSVFADPAVGMWRKVSAKVPLSAYLGVVGMPGVTAWVGVNRILQPQAGETLLVSAASGAVGSVVGQLAKAKGARVVGLAGGPDKCAYVRDDLGFDACLDHKALPDLASMQRALAEVAPNGVDCVFENVGGVGFDAALGATNAFARVAVCGLIAGYNGEPIALTNTRALLVNRLRVQGFIVTEHPDAWPPALAELEGLVAAGALRFRQSVSQGLASAPEAFIGLLQGRNFGKQLVQLVG